MRESAGRRPLPALGLTLVVALLVAIPLAAAAELTRDEYVERVEPICKSGADATSRLLKGVQGQIKKQQLVPAGKRVIRASATLASTTRRIAAVPRPSADTAKLTKWIHYLQLQDSLLRKIGESLKAEDRAKANGYANQLNHFNSLANNTVVGFGFHACQANSSKYL